MMKTFTILVMILLLAACSSPASDMQAQAELERERRLTEQQAALAAQQQAAMLAIQQSQAQAAAANAQIAAALAQRRDGVQIPENVAILAMFWIILLSSLGAIAWIVTRRSTPGRPSAPSGVQILLPHTPEFHSVLMQLGGGYINGQPVDHSGAPVALLQLIDEEEL